MASAFCEYLSAFKIKYHDNLPDYERGKLSGGFQTHLAYILVSLAVVLICVYKRYSFITGKLLNHSKSLEDF